MPQFKASLCFTEPHYRSSDNRQGFKDKDEDSKALRNVALPGEYVEREFNGICLVLVGRS